jgi:hypothetical protein
VLDRARFTVKAASDTDKGNRLADDVTRVLPVHGGRWGPCQSSLAKGLFDWWFTPVIIHHPTYT